jgi:hypothetical protein
VTTASVSAAGLVEKITLTGGGFVSFSPYATVWTAKGGDGNYHLYSANLSNLSQVPTQVQVSNLSVPGGGNPLDSSCFYQGYTNLLDPTSAFFIVEVPTTNTCVSGNPTGNSFVLVHLTDTPATAPVTLPASINTLSIEEEFSTVTGAMTGLVLVDGNSNLNFYPVSGFPGFTGAIAIKTNVTFEGHALIASDRAGHALPGGSLVFEQVKDNALGNHLIFRIDSSGAFTQVYSTTGTINGSQLGNGSDVNDNGNIYFYDAAGPVGAYTSVKFVKMPFAGSPLTTLYTDSAPGLKSYSLVDADGTVLIIHASNPSPPTPNISLLTLATGSAGTPTTLTSVSSSSAFDLNAFLDFASDHLFVNTLSTTVPTSSAVYTPSTGTLIGGQGGAGTAYSAFNFGVYFGSAGVVLELMNVTTPYPIFGGASVFTVNAGSFASTQVKLAPVEGGANYQVPTGDHFLVFPLSPTIGIGAALAGSGNSIGIAADVSKSQILTLAPPNTSVFPF